MTKVGVLANLSLFNIAESELWSEELSWRNLETAQFTDTQNSGFHMENHRLCTVFSLFSTQITRTTVRTGRWQRPLSKIAHFALQNIKASQRAIDLTTPQHTPGGQLRRIHVFDVRPQTGCAIITEIGVALDGSSACTCIF